MTARPKAPFLDLQSFLSFLENSGRLNRVKSPVDKNHEIACIARWAIESTPEEDSYAILFENVAGHDAPVAVNVYGSRQACADALGCAPESLWEHWAEALDQPLDTVPVESAPVQEVVLLGEQADLNSMPVPVWTPGLDAGPYLSAGSVITKDPMTNIQNMASYRIQIHDGKRAGLFFGSALQHGAIHLRKHGDRGASVPVAGGARSAFDAEWKSPNAAPKFAR